ncbi:hypothetical protein CLIBASIA_00190 [Candidatus Liberibacter asiaticus str. psy62]|uniref:Uncharacterized protein n=1 Tax=Liberibacter asiaticus (strain psy62) TaxID=537021 RepID=C6XH83_LIBAP|nr:hypothetical protein CLIBASIA_00190 [Candidatus Liberibacter asiaticus str. psy62]BAP25913.1 hypothetical protein CGUJ_00190 [Candidatus Liberibacter asiaticus str. Ishi-1]
MFTILYVIYLSNSMDCILGYMNKEEEKLILD